MSCRHATRARGAASLEYNAPVFGTSDRSPAHTEISVKLVLETAAVHLLLVAGSVWLAWTWLWPALLLALGLWLDRMYAVGHEAVHRKLFPDRPRLNDLVGAVMLAPLLAPLAVFRKDPRVPPRV